MKLRMLATLGVGALWGGAVALCTGWLTFPGDALAVRAQHEVFAQSDGVYQLELGDLSPWWFGLSTDSAKLYQAKPGADSELLLLATDARAAVSPFSLLRRQPYVSGSLTLGTDGQLDYAVATRAGADGGPLQVGQVQLDSEAFPLDELFALMPSSQGSASGAMRVHVEVDMPEGIASTSGRLELHGRGLALKQPVVMDFPLGRDVAIQDFDLAVELDGGRGRVTRGRLVSDFANVDISGTIALADRWQNSTVELRIEATLDESMAAMAKMFSAAEVNGKLVFRCEGRVANLQRVCQPGERRAAARGGAAGRGRPDRAGRAAGAVAAPKSVGGLTPRPGATSGGELTDAEREARRAELQERIRKRREERRATRAQRPSAGRPSREAIGGDGEEPFLDDELLDDEPLDDPGLDGEPLDDELGDEEFLDDGEFLTE